MYIIGDFEQAVLRGKWAMVPMMLHCLSSSGFISVIPVWLMGASGSLLILNRTGR